MIGLALAAITYVRAAAGLLARNALAEPIKCELGVCELRNRALQTNASALMKTALRRCHLLCFD